MPPPSKRRNRMGSGGVEAPSPAAEKQTVPKPDISLFMDCVDEELSEAQQEFFNKKQAEFKDVMKKLEDIAKAGARVTPNKDNSVTFRVTETTTTLGPVVTQTVAPVGGVPALNNTAGYRLLMDPKTGRIIGTLPGTVTSVGTVAVSAVSPVIQTSSPITVTGQQVRPMGVAAKPQVVPRVTLAPRTRPTAPSATRIRPTVAGTRPTARESTTAVKVAPIVDLTKPGADPVGAPAIRKTFPSLSVQAKPQRTIANAGAKRSELDQKVKSLLVHLPAKFTEWLIQQGLVRSEQYETGPGGEKIKLKLVMYSDVKKSPHSGGYVWLEDRGPASKHISVFKGSIFEIGTLAPSVILKILYHWSCQTNIPNVAQWVKVDNTVIDRFFTICRSICVGAVQDEVIGLGGSGRVVEIGVISLGTSTQDGTKREVRVEVLGVLDRATRNVRLRATEPVQGASQQARFTKIFEPLGVWLNKNSKIVTDYSVDKETLLGLGFKSVSQCSLNTLNSSRPESTNRQVMDYLKKVVPKMFQNTLSNLATPVIQQFLDELSFREMFGHYPLACFDSILHRISAQTQACATQGETMMSRLSKVATNPFLDWRYSERVELSNDPKAVSGSPVGSAVAGKRATPSPAPTGSKRSASPEEDYDALISKQLKVSKELVQLESYFYSTIQGEEKLLEAEFKADMAFKCHICKKIFMNNIEFMKHLHLHVECDRATAIDLADLTQCKYCYKDFDTPFKMQEHFEEIHLKKGSSFVCRICNESFNVKNGLIYHMSKEHVKFEMPYACKVCNFRASMHRDIIDHFHEVHDRTDKLQCPLCLKTYVLYGDKGYNSGSAISFMQHLQRHEDNRKKSTSSCRKCTLIFINDQGLKAHLEKDHVSFKDFENVEPFEYVATDEPTMMPKPDERNARAAAKKSGLAKAPPQQSAFAAQNLEDLLIYDADREKCCECDRGLTQSGHFTAYLCCTKCRYSSCCNKAMTVHVQLFHTKTPPEFSLGKPIMLDSPLFCCCGFNTNSGNKLAKHLAAKGCRSAYPSKEAGRKAQLQATSAGFAPLISLEDEEAIGAGMDPSIAITQAYKAQGGSKKEKDDEDKGRQGPLAFLGLGRRESNEEGDGAGEDSDEDNMDENDAENLKKFKENEKPSRTKKRAAALSTTAEEDAVNTVAAVTAVDAMDTDDGAATDQDPDDPDPMEDGGNDKKDDDEETNEENDEDKTATADKEETAHDAPKEDEDENVRVTGGPILFGTLHRYMGEKKEGDNENGEGNEPAAEKADSSSATTQEPEGTEEEGRAEEAAVDNPTGAAAENPATRGEAVGSEGGCEAPAGESAVAEEGEQKVSGNEEKVEEKCNDEEKMETE